MIRAGFWLALAVARALRFAPVHGAGPATPAAVSATPRPAAPGVELPGAVPVAVLIQNTGVEDDRVRGGSTPIAERVELHRTRLVAGQREMQSLPEGIAIPAESTLVLELGASHPMLVGLRRDLVQSDTFPLTLSFDRAGEVTVTARVRRKVDAAGVPPIPPVVAGDLSISLASAPPAPAATPAVH